MQEFIAAHRSKITGVLSGFDRLVFRGTRRQMAYAEGLGTVLGVEGVRLTDFGDWANELSTRLKAAIDAGVKEFNRPSQYVSSSRESKEELVRSILRDSPVDSGVVCVLSAVEPCQSYEIHRNRERRRLQLRSVRRKCKHVYWYILHPEYGLVHVRLQTWVPFSVQVCLNGREWLSRQMDLAGIDYERSDNCFPWIADLDQAQALMDEQRRTAWPTLLESLLESVHPLHGKLLSRATVPYYWSTYQAEWATDVLFNDREYLPQIVPLLHRYAMIQLSCEDVLRFLAKPAHGRVVAEVASSLKTRHEGVRIKHLVNSNSVKFYDKTQALLRIESTINQPRDFRVWRSKEGDDTDASRSWRSVRKGVADLHRLTQICDRTNHRYLDALAHANTEDPKSLKDTLAEITKPTTLKQRRVRALRPFDRNDGQLLEAVSRGEFITTGFRNRDLRRLLETSEPESKQEARRQSARVSRLLRLLRAHGLIHKIQGTHRYLLTTRGRKICPLVTGARSLTVGVITQALAEAA